MSFELEGGCLTTGPLGKSHVPSSFNSSNNLLRSFFLKLLFYLFIIGCSVSLLLCGFFCSCDEQGLLSSCGAQVPHCSGFFFCRARTPGHAGFRSYGSQVLECRLSSCGPPATWQVGSSQTRDQICVSCIDR